jgi:hypothetical protein
VFIILSSNPSFHVPFIVEEPSPPAGFEHETNIRPANTNRANVRKAAFFKKGLFLKDENMGTPF